LRLSISLNLTVRVAGVKFVTEKVVDDGWDSPLKESHRLSLALPWTDEQLRRVRRREAYTEEARLMELLADEEADEQRLPDESGDDFEG
jgi:hypothetical protein